MYKDHITYLIWILLFAANVQMNLSMDPNKTTSPTPNVTLVTKKQEIGTTDVSSTYKQTTGSTTQSMTSTVTSSGDVTVMTTSGVHVESTVHIPGETVVRDPLP